MNIIDKRGIIGLGTIAWKMLSTSNLDDCKSNTTHYLKFALHISHCQSAVPQNITASVMEKTLSETRKHNPVQVLIVW